MQFPEWGRKFGYSAVEVKLDVLQKHLKETPMPLSLATAEMMEKENLHVNDTLYRVHYPAKPKLYIRCENAEQICVVEGNWALTLTFLRLHRGHCSCYQ